MQANALKKETTFKNMMGKVWEVWPQRCLMLGYFDHNTPSQP